MSSGGDSDKHFSKGKGQVDLYEDLFSHSDDDDDDDYDSDDSDGPQQTVADFFAVQDGMNKKQICEDRTVWHCPAYKGGRGGTRGYKDLRALLEHAKNQLSVRVKLHRELRRRLEDSLGPLPSDLRRRKSRVPGGEMVRRCQGLDEGIEKDIVWPPMVVVRNTVRGQDGYGKWVGMGNEELLEHFSGYNAVRARHAYGPQGHRGISLLVFEPSAWGYLEADRLSKQFQDDSRDRKAWEQSPNPFCGGGKRELYGYMAEQKDIDLFNRHCRDKNSMKFEICSYQRKVVEVLKHGRAENQQLQRTKSQVEEDQMPSEGVEASPENKLLTQHKEECVMESNEHASPEQAEQEFVARKGDKATDVDCRRMAEARPLKKRRTDAET